MKLHIVVPGGAKHCHKCSTTKPVSEFHCNRRAKDGLQSWCKPCQAAANQNPAKPPTCGMCKRGPEETLFYKGQRRCAECNRAKCREWQQNNPSQKQALRVAGIERTRRLVMAYLLTHPCVDCGERDPVVLEFDHRRDKRKNIGSMLTHGTSTKTMMDEIAKCDVRCANCHRRKTSRERGFWKCA